MAWKGKTRGGLLGYKIFVSVLKTFGIKPAYLLLRIVSAYFLLFSPYAVNSIKKYFGEIHGKKGSDLWKSVYASFYVFGQTILDKIAIMSGMENKYTYDFNGEENLVELKNRGRGGVLVSAHLGNWDIAGFLLKRIGVKINVVMFEAEHEKIKNYLSKIMDTGNMNVIPIKSDLSHIISIRKALANNEIICIHGDRFVQGSRVAYKKFLGKKAYFPSGVFSIIDKFKVPYTFVYCVKGAPDSLHYKLSSTPVFEPDGTLDDIIENYIQVLEEKVSDYPNQWFNYYDFWSENTVGAAIDM
ncbi:LpxL/LpxP family acyltransferase [Marinigracilibium pacificum]|uniref:Lipid A biosynthesis acyltransferase n=1 Tax=Marinigracilibium pacificum TaxID=2729599 RepID=A0A848IXH4_9BACT|nr:lipid A biosynthesis acyltransferase [Marinigracilibium pacificum]NMM47868.1 lipid A biosynthesis acyltransferase [Marinigracilibium pacificum]